MVKYSGGKIIWLLTIRIVLRTSVYLIIVIVLAKTSPTSTGRGFRGRLFSLLGLPPFLHKEGMAWCSKVGYLSKLFMVAFSGLLSFGVAPYTPFTTRLRPRLEHRLTGSSGLCCWPLVSSPRTWRFRPNTLLIWILRAAYVVGSSFNVVAQKQ